jgi:hypothetical protein
MIPKSVQRFSEKIMLKQEASGPIPKFASIRGTFRANFGI